MTAYRCSKCKKIVYRDRRHREYHGKVRIRSYCTNSGKQAILTMIKKSG